ncbi:Acetyltransferase (GNAT) family protein [Vibrio aerogenes CECT 7868]|uniref:Acetyltransferase (GNAT) family protein n=1 Tax=Vibrio aerogenes CECT 7868 TaxID=1216006 RepID=A0A1M5ZED5_9VIBR|nr:GNAT family N-acetyltransferase [Vibrio aerogenes]SHI22615.1 Acetyltransferase (GNAT) family protein [Vibrio aerogenes CECT 7868]
MEVKYQKAQYFDGELLAGIRVKAMRESLEAIGRFDPKRARDRFLDHFCPEETSMILVENRIVGFYSLSTKDSYLYLSHLYILPEYQGKGIGYYTLNRIKEMASGLNYPLRLGALRGSPSNDFYKANGFRFSHEQDWDLYYVWEQSGQARHASALVSAHVG